MNKYGYIHEFVGGGGKEYRVVHFLKSKRKMTSLVIQQLRIHLAMQGTWGQSLVWEDPTCMGELRPCISPRA